MMDREALIDSLSNEQLEALYKAVAVLTEEYRVYHPSAPGEFDEFDSFEAEIIEQIDRNNGEDMGS